MCWTFGETHKPLVVNPVASCWLSVPVRDEKKWVPLTADVQAAFLKGEFQHKDRVLCCWHPKNGPSSDWQLVPRKWWEISIVLVQVGFRKQRMCLGLFTLHSSAGVLSGVLHVDDMLGTGERFDETTEIQSLRKAVWETFQWRNHDFHEGIHSECGERFV